MKYIIIAALALLFTACRQQPKAKQMPAAKKKEHTTPPPAANVSTAQDAADDNSHYEFRRYLVTSAADTAVQVISQKSAIVVAPDSLQVVQMVKQYGAEDFTTIADDNANYQSAAEEFLRKKPVALVTPAKRYIKLAGLHNTYLIDTKAKVANGWFTLFFKPDSPPLIADMTDIETAYQNYFERSPM
ncbi:hypothetical protein [Mucilaginibacter sp.]